MFDAMISVEFRNTAEFGRTFSPLLRKDSSTVSTFCALDTSMDQAVAHRVLYGGMVVADSDTTTRRQQVLFTFGTKEKS